MSNLLHSKTFRGNLIKWLILYALVLLIIVGVVTYSKYISSMTKENDARAAKFKVNITQGEVCSTTSPEVCGLEKTGKKYKAYDELEYIFTVDTSNLEVLTLVEITVKIHNDFKVVSLNNETFPETGTLTTDLDENTELNYTNNQISLVSNVKPGQTENAKTYKLILKAKDSNYQKTDHSYIKDSDNQNGAVYVGYSAIQQK